jgi:hypothetical protein
VSLGPRGPMFRYATSAYKRRDFPDCHCRLRAHAQRMVIQQADKRGDRRSSVWKGVHTRHLVGRHATLSLSVRSCTLTDTPFHPSHVHDPEYDLRYTVPLLFDKVRRWRRPCWTVPSLTLGLKLTEVRKGRQQRELGDNPDLQLCIRYFAAQ